MKDEGVPVRDTQHRQTSHSNQRSAAQTHNPEREPHIPTLTTQNDVGNNEVRDHYSLDTLRYITNCWYVG